jgi:polar amino acid transport system substrate-binding protein
MAHILYRLCFACLCCALSTIGTASAIDATLSKTDHPKPATVGAPTIITVFVQEALDSKGHPLPVSSGLLNFFQFFERNAGLHLQAVTVPWNRAKQMTLDGKGIIWGFSKSPERLMHYRFSETVMKSRIWAIGYGEPQLALRSIKDLKNKTISVERGVSHGMEFELAKNKIFKIDEDAAQASARFRKLIAKRSDVLLWGLLQFDRQDLFLDYLHKIYLPGLRDPELLGKKFYASTTPLFYDSIHFASAKGQLENEMKKIDAAIKQGFKSGELTKLVNVLN